MGNRIGVMQGRLVPKYQGRYQAHPLGYWQDEFDMAQDIGLDCIEFILDYNDAELNPLLKAGGVDEILAVSERTGVVVKTVCADYFMEAPLHTDDQTIAGKSYEILQRLLANAARLDVNDIVIPCVDHSSLDSDAAKGRLVERLAPLLDQAEKLDINLSLETDLAPQPFLKLLDRFNSMRVTVNYDIGNSAALGYDPVEELNAYGNRVTDIHIKDRVRGGGSVVLGDGNADFDTFFAKLNEFDYQGPFIMQAYRDNEGVEIFRQQLAWMDRFLS